MITPDNCALFIGVNDYRAFDASMGHPAGTSDLHGSLNDARAFWRVCRELGIPQENLLILTSPALDPAELGAPASSVGEATEEGILAGVAWLAARLGGESRPPGLLTYSGHGDFIEGEGVVLCPSDVTGASLTHAIPFAKLSRLLAKDRAIPNLTVVLDCCHSGGSAAVSARRRLSLTGRPLPAGLERAADRLGDRELCACKVGESSWQARFSGVFRGAFSWALTAVLEQWKPRIEGTSVELELSYGDLLVRTRQVLQALSFEEEPVLNGPAGIARTPFFHRGPGGAGEATSLMPSARRKGGQLDPNTSHLLLTSLPGNDWEIYATAASNGLLERQGYTNATEYWGLDSSFVRAVQSIAEAESGSITFGTAASGAPQSRTGFSMPTNSLWTELRAMPTGKLFCALVRPTDGSPEYSVGISFDLTAPARAGAIWGGAITWYVGVASGETPPEYVIGEGTTTLRYQGFQDLSTDLTRWSWAFMTLPPLSWAAVTSRVQSSVGAVSLAALDATLYAAVSSDSRMAFTTCSYSPSDGVWSSRGSDSIPVAASPSIAAKGTTLYLAYQSSNSGGDVYLASCADPSNTDWSLPGDTRKAATAGGFALAGTDQALYLAQIATSSSNVIVSQWDGHNVTSWSTEFQVSEAATGTPALAAFNDLLYLAFTTTDRVPTIRIYHGSKATPPGVPLTLSPITDGSSGGFCGPALAVFNGRLFLACRDASSNEVWICSTSDGTTWSGYEKLTDQNPSIKAALHPALAALGNVFYLAYPAPNGSSADVSTVSTLIPG